MSDLNGKKLRPSEAIESRVLPGGTRLMKQTSMGEYLALNPEQQSILDLFDGVKTVQEVLHSLLARETRPRIRAFYDLVMIAIRKGFLFEGQTQTINGAMVGHQWKIRWGPMVAIILSSLAILAGAAALVISKITLAKTMIEWIEIIFVISIGLSLSNVMAGMVLSGFGRLVYSPGLRWNRVLPFFSVDIRDAFMGGRLCEICVALQAFSAPFFMAVVAWFLDSPTGLVASCFTALILASPFGHTPAHNLLHALFRKQYQLPKCAAKFLDTKMITQAFNWKEKLVEEKYLFIYSTYAICWLGALFRFGFNQLYFNGLNLYRGFLYEGRTVNRMFAAVGCVFLALLVAAPVGYLLWLILKGAWRLAAPHLFKAESALVRGQNDAVRPSEEEIVKFLGGTLLFAQLPAEDLRKIAGAMKLIAVGMGATIIRERDFGDAMFVVYSGRVEVLKEDEAGESVTVANLVPGDVFGEIALLDHVPRTSSVRSTETTRLLVLSQLEFERLLVSSLGVGKIKTSVQVCAFLKRNALFADWHPQALMTLSNEFVFQDFRAGEVVIHQDQPNDSFFVVHEGQFEVRKNGKPVTVLAAGDFCGEISLLRDRPATAEVVALHPGRCLKLGKEKFLKFVSQDFLTGIAIETALEKRADGGPK